jgi:Zn-finger nucleic acid-binding protein
MQCPNCQSTLQPAAFETVPVQECPQCSGIWFEHHGLVHYLDSDPDLRWLSIDFWRETTDFHAMADRLPCPKCSKYNLTRLVDRETDTSVAVCNNCQGMWIGADQLRTIIHVLIGYADRMDSGDYIRQSLHQASQMIAEMPHKPASHWQDLMAVLRMLKYRIYSEHPKLVSMLVGAQESLPI